ncbi:HEAT repeat domain-containing protein [Bacteroidota bacterium]
MIPQILSTETMKNQLYPSRVRVAVMLWWRLRQLNSRKPARRIAAVEKIMNLRNPRTVGLLIGALKDDSVFVRRAAAWALAQVGDVRSVEPLVDALKVNTSVIERMTVVEALWAIDPNWAQSQTATVTISEIVAELGLSHNRGHTYDHECATQVQELIKTIGEPSVEPLIAMLKSPGQKVKVYAIEVLSQLRDRRAIKPLADTLTDENCSVRKAAAVALKRLRWKPSSDIQRARLAVAHQDWQKTVDLQSAALNPLTIAINDRQYRVREEALLALGKIRDARATETLLAALMDPNTNTRAVAAKSLKLGGWEPTTDAEKAMWAVAVKDWQAAVLLGEVSVSPLLVIIRDSHQEEFVAAADALGRIGDSRAVLPLIEILTRYHPVDELKNYSINELGCYDSNEPYRNAAAAALGQIGDARAVEFLISMLESARSSHRQRETMARALGQIGDPRAAVALAMAAVKSPREAVFDKALFAIGPPAVEPLVAALGDYEAREAAAEALGKIGDKSAVDGLAEQLKYQEYDNRFGWKLGVALARIGGRRAVDQLIEVLEDGKGYLRAAAYACEIIGDPRTVGALASVVSKWAGSGPVYGAHDALRKILENSADEVSDEDLNTLTLLEDKTVWQFRSSDHSWDNGTWDEEGMNLESLRTLAREELNRRGRGDG